MDTLMKILVIDDDPSMTDMLGLILKSASAYVIAANSGTDGVRLTREQSPDLIILDIMMPDMDGMQVCDAVRKFSSVPILILSALDTPGTIAAALNSGADDYLVKPVACNMLLARIEQLIRRSHQEAGLINHHVVV
jgi:two-component system, OmpR family, KDP operon response regulator KdpE